MGKKSLKISAPEKVSKTPENEEHYIGLEGAIAKKVVDTF